MAIIPIRFQLRTGGTGSTIGSAVKLGFDDDEVSDRATASWALQLDGPLIRCIVDTFYFGTESSVGTQASEIVIRKSAQEYCNSIASLCQYRPHQVKELSRGKAVIPHVHEGWGDVQLLYASPVSVLLDNCTLESAEVVDDTPMLIGAALRFTFVRVRDSLAP